MLQLKNTKLKIPCLSRVKCLLIFTLKLVWLSLKDVFEGSKRWFWKEFEITYVRKKWSLVFFLTFSFIRFLKHFSLPFPIKRYVKKETGKINRRVFSFEGAFCNYYFQSLQISLKIHLTLYYLPPLSWSLSL